MFLYSGIRPPTKKIFDILNNLNVKKPLSQSLIPAWALKDAREHIAEPLCFD